MDARNRSYSPHLSLAKSYWKNLLLPGDFAIDMTCGGGHDTKFLSELLSQGSVFSLDIQEIALKKARELAGETKNIRFIHQSHADPILTPFPSPPKLIVYNLGYFPGGDKSLTTQTKTTIESVEKAADMLAVSGALCITCYPGHAEGSKEEKALIGWAESLEKNCWSVCFHQWINKPLAPSLLWIIKLK